MDSSQHTGASARLTSTGGTDFSAQIVSLRSGVVLDLQATTWTTTGHRERGHVTARLTLDQALELERLIASAIATASEFPTPGRLPSGQRAVPATFYTGKLQIVHLSEPRHQQRLESCPTQSSQYNSAPRATKGSASGHD